MRGRDTFCKLTTLVKYTDPRATVGGGGGKGRWSFACGGDRPVAYRMERKTGYGCRCCRRRVRKLSGARRLDGRWFVDWLLLLLLLLLRLTSSEAVHHPPVKQHRSRRQSFGKVPRERTTDQLLASRCRSSDGQPLHVERLLLLHY